MNALARIRGSKPVIFLAVGLFLSACGKTPTDLNPLRSPAIPETSANQGKVNSGDIGYQYSNSALFLKEISSRLADEIESMDPSTFKDMPVNLGQYPMANIIRNVRFKYGTTKGKDPNGMFDYGVDRKGMYISALKPFFDSYQLIPIGEVELATPVKAYPDFYKLNADEVRHKLLHEFAHLLSLGQHLSTAKLESKAKKFVSAFDRAQAGNLIICHSNGEGELSAAIVQRSTGRAFVLGAGLDPDHGETSITNVVNAITNSGFKSDLLPDSKWVYVSRYVGDDQISAKDASQLVYVTDFSKFVKQDEKDLKIDRENTYNFKIDLSKGVGQAEEFNFSQDPAGFKYSTENQSLKCQASVTPIEL